MLAAPPLARSAGPSSAPAGPGRPAEEEAGGGDGQLDRKWVGLASPHPHPLAGAPRDGGAAEAVLAFPFLFACLEPQRLPTSRPLAGLSGGGGIPYLVASEKEA